MVGREQRSWVGHRRCLKTLIRLQGRGKKVVERAPFCEPGIGRVNATAGFVKRSWSEVGEGSGGLVSVGREAPKVQGDTQYRG